MTVRCVSPLGDRVSISTSCSAAIAARSESSNVTTEPYRNFRSNPRRGWVAKRYPPAVPARYDANAALVVVDMQNDVADPNGSLFVKGAGDILPMVNSEIRIAREAGAFVVYTQDWHPESTSHFAKDGGIWPVHCVGGTWGADFHPDLAVSGPSVKKGENGED